MPNGGNQFGQFGAAIPGGAGAVRAALQRRQQGGTPPQLGQVTGGQPGAERPPVTGGTPSPAGPARPQAGGPATESEARIIINALKERLRSDSKIRESMVERATQPPALV